MLTSTLTRRHSTTMVNFRQSENGQFCSSWVPFCVRFYTSAVCNIQTLSYIVSKFPLLDGFSNVSLKMNSHFRELLEYLAFLTLVPLFLLQILPHKIQFACIRLGIVFTSLKMEDVRFISALTAKAKSHSKEIINITYGWIILFREQKK